MISATYGISGLLLLASGLLFQQNMLSVTAQAAWIAVIFFVASSAASSAYLTVSEIFPLEIRAFAIAIFYAIGTFVGGVGAPSLFAKLIASNSRTQLLWGYAASAALMIGAAIVEAVLGVKAERQSLESISTPLQAR